MEISRMIQFNPMSTLVQIQSRFVQLLLILLLGVMSLPANSGAQGVSSEGKEFWIGFMPNFDVPSQAVAVFVASGTSNRVKIETYGDGGTVIATQTVNLAPDQVHRFNLSVGLSETREREKPVYRAIRVTSTAPCVVYGYSDNALSTDGYLGIPISGLGKEYYCFSYPDDYYYFIANSHLGGEFLVVAPYDGTEITIKTTSHTTTTDDGKTISRTPGEVWKVTLNKGQTYLVQTTGYEWGSDDLTGSRVTGTKPFAFLTGHQRAQVGNIGDNSKDHLIEMIPPVDRWGTEYFMVPHKSRTICGDYIRVLSAEDNNTIDVNGSTKTINAGEWFEVPEQTVATTFRSVSKKKFLVMDYSYYQGFNGDQAKGDPHIITMIPKEQFQNRIIFRTPENVGSAFEHYVTIVYHKDFVGQVKLKKGSNAPQGLSSYGSSGPISFPNSDYVAELCRVSGDIITWIAEAPTPMGIYQYGYTQTEAYGWPAGMALKVLQIDPVPPLEAKRVEDCGDFDVELTETHLMPQDTFDDTRISMVDMITELNDARWSKPSFNYTFELAPDFVVGNDRTTFKLRVFDKTQDAYAAIFTVDQAGNDTVYEYSYNAPKLSASPLPTYKFQPVLVDQDSCMTITFKNEQTTELEVNNATIMGIAQGGEFRVSPTDINRKLAPGETFTVQVCFTPRDTVIAIDTLTINTTCAPFKYALLGEGVIPKIFAEDKDFGSVDPTKESCGPVRIYNRGKYRLVINAQDLSTGNPDFNIDPTQVFPIIILPGGYAEVNFCFTPAVQGDYTVTLNYETNIPTRFKALDKSFSVLKGISRVPGAKLTVLNQDFGPTNCMLLPVYIDTLYNDEQKDNFVTKIEIQGPGKDSYKIIQTTPNNRLENFVLPANTPKEDGIKYHIQFDPNVAGTTTAPQIADLVAITTAGIIPITHLSGSRIAPELAVTGVTPNVDLGVVKTNASTTQTFVVTNNGTDVLQVTNIVVVNGDVGVFTVDQTTFALAPGASRTITITGTAGNESRLYTSDIEVQVEQPNCTPSQTFPVILRANSNMYTAQGADYKTIFQCHDRTLPGSFSNFSSEESIIITDIEVVNDAGMGWNNAGDFRLVTDFTGTELLDPNESYNVPVIFTPSANGVRNAALKFTFTLEGVTKDTIVLLTGIGDLVPQVLAVGDLNGSKIYTATMNDVVKVPVLVKEEFTGRNAGVRGYRFDISFKQDAFSFADEAGPQNITVQKTFIGTDANGYDTWRINTVAASPTDLTVDNFAAELELHPRVTREERMESDIIVSNAAWIDSSGADICYIPTDYVPAKYVFDPLCGDNALQSWLDGKTMKEIAFGSIAPNPVKSDAEISFDVNLGDASISLSVYDVLGNEVVKIIDREAMKPGSHKARIDASTLPEGTYYVKLSNGRMVETKRLTISK